MSDIFARGVVMKDVAPSIAVASVSTLIAPVVTPLLVLFLAGSFLEIDAGSIVLDIVKTVLLPVIAGLLARLFFKNLIAKLLPALPWASAVVISLIVAIVVAGSASKIVAAGGIVFLAVVLHNGFGLGLGYLAGKLGRLDDKARRALAFEEGMQNSGLAATLATAHFTPLAALPSAVFHSGTTSPGRSWQHGWPGARCATPDETYMAGRRTDSHF